MAVLVLGKNKKKFTELVLLEDRLVQLPCAYLHAFIKAALHGRRPNGLKIALQRPTRILLLQLASHLAFSTHAIKRGKQSQQ